MIIKTTSSDRTLQEYLNNKYPRQKNKRVEEDYFEDIFLWGDEQFPVLELSLSKKRIIRDRLTFKENKWKYLVDLQIGENQIKDVLTIWKCPSLETIDCANNSLTKLDLRFFKGNLKKLLVNNNRLTEIIWPQYTNLSEMDELDLSSNELRGNLNFIRGFTNLQWLKLNDNYFEGDLEPLKDFCWLEELNINDTNITSGLEYLSNMSRLERLFCYIEKKHRHKTGVVQLVIDLGFHNTEIARSDRTGETNFVSGLTAYGNFRWQERWEEELQLEREIHEESLKGADRHYRQQIVELNAENARLKKELEQAKEQIKELYQLVNQIEINTK